MAAPPVAAPLGRLKRRPDFLRVAGSGRKWVTPGLILQAARRGRGDDPVGGPDDPKVASEAVPGAVPGAVPEAVRVGFTVSRKVGNAVARNRARRRLKAAAEDVLPLAAEPGCDYVTIGRSGTLTRQWPALKQDLETALQGRARRRGQERRPQRGAPRGERREQGRREQGCREQGSRKRESGRKR